MSFVLILAIITLVAVTAIVLPIIVFIVGHSKNWSWVARFSSLLPLIAVIFFLYYQFRTPESFYRDEYKIITQMKFPESGEIQYSTSTSMSFNGDYTSAFLVELERKDIRLLKQKMVQRGFNQGKVIPILNDELDYIQSKVGCTTYDAVYNQSGANTYLVGFLDDQKSVILYHSN